MAFRSNNSVWDRCSTAARRAWSKMTAWLPPRALARCRAASACPRHGALAIYRNTPENAEVAGDAGIPFEPEELVEKIQLVLRMSEPEREALRIGLVRGANPRGASNLS